MEHYVRVHHEFEASHQLTGEEPDRPRCSRLHGHRWTVQVEKRGREDGLEADVYEIVLEIADKHINEMYPKFNPSPEQLAQLFMERLLLAHPTIVAVEIGDGRVTGISRNTPR